MEFILVRIIILDVRWLVGFYEKVIGGFVVFYIDDFVEFIVFGVILVIGSIWIL